MNDEVKDLLLQIENLKQQIIELRRVNRWNNYHIEKLQKQLKHNHEIVVKREYESLPYTDFEYEIINESS